MMRQKIYSVLNALLLCYITEYSFRLIHPVAAFQSQIQLQTPTKTIMGSSADNDNNNNNNDFKVKTWNPLRLLVLRLGFTEPAWTSPLNYQKKVGTFNCAYCGQKLFDSESKYDSGSGWPSFWRTTEEGALDYKMEFDGRLECRCGRCKSHLGHVFLDGPRPESVPENLLSSRPDSDPRGRNNARLPRFCVNGASLMVQDEESTP
jgi:peptide-methionine (R)-S-oxide reductase